MLNYRALFDLSGRGIGLTGGGGHLGRPMALALAAHGAIVVICGRNEDRLRAVADEAREIPGPGRVIPHRADVGVAEDVEVVLDVIESEAGAVAGWVNNAIPSTPAAFLEATPEQAARAVAGGLTSVYLILQAVCNRMLAAKGGAIVNVASMYGVVSPQSDMYRSHPEFHNPPLYGASKAAVIQLTRYFACHLGTRGVRVNAVCPGPFPSERTQEHETFVSELASRSPLGRIGTPDELTGAVVFLLSDAASYVTGANLMVDGGWTAW
jgi:NAD(P)-dependent dehydrogenase (short-subunit alcohol dehydrogenase family)